MLNFRRILKSSTALSALALVAPTFMAPAFAIDAWPVIDDNVAYVIDTSQSKSQDGTVYVGQFNDGQSLEIKNNGTGTFRSAIIGAASSNNTVIVSGLFANSVTPTFAVPGAALIVGLGGDNNHLLIQNGGVVSILPVSYSGEGPSDLHIGYLTGSDNNKITVTGAGSHLDATNNTTTSTLYVGYAGNNNSLEVLNGGAVNAYQMRVGGGTNSASGSGLDAPGSGNSVLVSGAGSSLTTLGSFNLGATDANAASTAGASTNTLTVSDGAHVTIGLVKNKTFSVGYGNMANSNVAIVTGVGSALSAYDISVGNGVNNSNKLAITQDATVSATHNLVFASQSIYAVDVNTSAVTPLTVGNTTTLSATATVMATFFNTGFVTNRKLILQTGSFATDERFNATVDASALPTSIAASLSYDATGAYLDLTAHLGQGAGLASNQANVATSLNHYFNQGGAMPAGFLTQIFTQSGPALVRTLTQVSGETATGAQQVAARSTGGFLDMLTGAPDQAAVSAAPIAYAPVTPAQAAADRIYGGTGKPSAVAMSPWTRWASLTGAGTRQTGDAGVGDNRQTTTGGTLAAGADYAVAPGASLGFAMAGNTTRWSSAQSLGGGDSQGFLAGVRGSVQLGSVYVSAAGAWSTLWVATDRVALSESLKAKYVGQSYGGRLETGVRLSGLLSAFTPYVAGQVQAFHNPAYAEKQQDGGLFALSYGANTALASRSELGTRVEQTMPVGDWASLTLRLRGAWAHTWTEKQGFTTGFVALPGQSAQLDGATTPANVAIVSGEGDLALSRSTSVTAKVSSELAPGYASLSARAGLKYAW